MKPRLNARRAVAPLLMLLTLATAGALHAASTPSSSAAPPAAAANAIPANADYDPTRPAPPPVVAPPARKVFGRTVATRSFIWEVKSPTTRVYLFGTIHVGKRAFYPLPEPVEAALDASARLVVEADITRSPSPEQMAPLISYTAPDSLEKHLPKPLYERLQAQLTRLRVPLDAVRPMRPFIVGGLLSIGEFSRLGYDMNLGVDSYLITRAREAGKPVLELESSEAQLKMMSNMPPDLQEAFLDNAVTTLEAGRTADQVTGMVNAWQIGDAALMQDVVQDVNRGLRQIARLDDVLLHGRHDAMLKKIEGYLAGSESHFVAVGSLHLVGPRGLLQALKAKGYELTQQ